MSISDYVQIITNYYFVDTRTLHKLSVDIQTLAGIQNTCYLRNRGHVAKAGNLPLAWVYAENPDDHGRFTNMLCVSPFIFDVILELIKDHEVFANNSNNLQTPVATSDTYFRVTEAPEDDRRTPAFRHSLRLGAGSSAGDAAPAVFVDGAADSAMNLAIESEPPRTPSLPSLRLKMSLSSLVIYGIVFGFGRRSDTTRTNMEQHVMSALSTPALYLLHLRRRFRRLGNPPKAPPQSLMTGKAILPAWGPLPDNFLDAPFTSQFTSIPEAERGTFLAATYKVSLSDKDIEKGFVATGKKGFAAKVDPTMACSRRLGNVYTVSLHSCLASVLPTGPSAELQGKRASFDFLEDQGLSREGQEGCTKVPQVPVAQQLAVALYRLGRYGNAASFEDIARVAGCSEGSIKNFTDRVFTAIESLHDMFVQPLTPEEKETEKVWIDDHMGFKGLWREGWLMYDGTIVVLYSKPGMNGHGYYTWKANYGLNLQIGNIPSSLRVADYSIGHTGSAHNSAAFEGTAVFKHPEWLFQGEEFAWGDSAYPLSSRVIPVYNRLASLLPANAAFNTAVSHIQVRSEHCMGTIKGRFQSLRGLHVDINSNEDHYEALCWITVAIILHNLVIDVEGEESGAAFRHIYPP
ncbi:DDE superfamily endonuclease-domain-containing protein [Mycena haematopus]|nr:DDE superfamily endonuclease-domain-containing protein [Mycena haematopus]